MSDRWKSLHDVAQHERAGPRQLWRQRPWLAVALTSAFLALLFALIGLGARLAGERADGWLATSLRVEEQASAFARSTDQDGCIREALRRSEGCGRLGVGCMTAANVFAVRCLDEAPATEGLCSELPLRTQVFETVRWRDAWCGSRSRKGEAGCEAIAASLQHHCQGE